MDEFLYLLGMLCLGCFVWGFVEGLITAIRKRRTDG